MPDSPPATSVAREPPFHVAVGTAPDGRTTVAVSGELDLASAGEMRSAVDEAIRSGDTLLDLRGVVFMDSSGVAALDGLLRLAAEHGRALVLCAPLQDPVQRLLELTGMLASLSFETCGDRA